MSKGLAARLVAAAFMVGSGRAAAEPARAAAAPIVVAPFDPNVYPPPAALPAGLQPMIIEDRAGQRQVCAGENGCLPRPGTFAGWFGMTGSIPRFVEVRVEALAPRPARGDRDWVGRVREATHDIEHHRVSFHHAIGATRIWRGPHGRVVQSEIQYGGRELDPAWKLSRHEERDGWTLHLEIRFYGWTDDATRTLLRATFADGPLGPAPATAKVIKRL